MIKTLGVFLGLVLLSSVSYASAQVTPYAESESTYDRTALDVFNFTENASATIAWIGESEFSVAYAQLAAPSQNYFLEIILSQTEECNQYRVEFTQTEEEKAESSKKYTDCLNERVDAVVILVELIPLLIELDDKNNKLIDENEKQTQELQDQTQQINEQTQKIKGLEDTTVNYAIGGLIGGLAGGALITFGMTKRLSK